VLGAKVGLMGTMENMIGSESIPTERTTPESFELQALLGQMRDAGCTHAIMEVSSHAIALERVGGLHYTVAAFTNLTEDHLDFHKTMEHYCDTKAELFNRCDKAVANCDDEWFGRLCGNAQCDMLTVSAKGKAVENVMLLCPLKHGEEAPSFQAEFEGDEIRVTVSLRGHVDHFTLNKPEMRFQRENGARYIF